MINKFGITPELSGVIPALLPFGNILLTPFFGNLYDRKGKGATIMIIGSVMLVFIHLMFSIPMLNNWVVALCLILLLGIAFSLVPSAMWPSVPKIIPENKLGTAYAISKNDNLIDSSSINTKAFVRLNFSLRQMPFFFMIDLC